MHKTVRLLWALGFFAVLAAANAQTPPPAGGAAFDGIYRVVSSTTLNATYTDRNGRTGPCPNRRPGPLHIENGRARYSSATGYRVRGTVGPQGELTMRAIGPSSWANQPIDLTVNGTVDGTGTARVRQLSHSCSYDFVWQRAAQ